MHIGAYYKITALRALLRKPTQELEGGSQGVDCNGVGASRATAQKCAQEMGSLCCCFIVFLCQASVFCKSFLTLVKNHFLLSAPLTWVELLQFLFLTGGWEALSFSNWELFFWLRPFQDGPLYLVTWNLKNQAATAKLRVIPTGLIL